MFCSPGPPATSAVACCGSSRSRGGRCGAWHGCPRGCRAGRLSRRRSYAGTSSILTLYMRRSPGVTTAYYLVHSLAASGPFARADRRGAENFAAAAQTSGVSRIIYLGGLGAEHDVSAHLESRHEVGRILRESGVPTIEFRASVIIGSGSVSFEIVRSLVERTPVSLIPRWVVSRTQPIAIEDVLAYLLAAKTSISISRRAASSRSAAPTASATPT